MRSRRAGRCGTPLLKHGGDEIHFSTVLRPLLEKSGLGSRPLPPPARRTPFSPSLSPLPAPFLSDTIHRRGTVTSDLTILPLSPQVQTCLSLEHCSPHKHKDTKSLTSSRCHRGMEEAEPESLETYLKFILDTGDSLLHGPLSGLLVYHI